MRPLPSPAGPALPFRFPLSQKNRSSLLRTVSGVLCCLTLALGFARAQEVGFTSQWFQVSLPEEVAPGWTLREGGAARTGKVEGIYFLSADQFKISASTDFRRKAPGSLWAFWEEFVARCEARDFAGLQALHNARGWQNVLSVVTTPEIRAQWEQVHAAVHWVSPYLAIHAGENTWIVYLRLDGPPYAFAPYKLGWNAAAQKWEIDAPDILPVYKKLALVLMNSGVEALAPVPLEGTSSVVSLDAPLAPVARAAANPVTPAVSPASITISTSALVVEEPAAPIRLPGPFIPQRFAVPFTNRGQETVALIRAEANCNCVVPQLPQKAFGPGEKGELRAVFNPGSKQGLISQTIVVTTTEGTAEKSVTVSFPVTFEVPPWVQVSPNIVWWKKDEERASKQAKVVFLVPDFELKSLRPIGEAAPAMEVSVSAIPGETGAYAVSFQPPATGRFTAVYELVTNRPDATGVQINVLVQ